MLNPISDVLQLAQGRQTGSVLLLKYPLYLYESILVEFHTLFNPSIKKFSEWQFVDERGFEKWVCIL